jgi:hypothetical protein
MNVTSVGATSSILNTRSTTAASTDADALPVASQSTISPEGGLFGELASLAHSDPAQFKKVAEEVSQKLKDAASQATGDQAKFLSKMADRFGQAAQTGDMSALKPEKAGGAHPHHHKHGDSGQDQSGTQSSPFQTISQVISSSLQDVTGTSSPSQA